MDAVCIKRVFWTSNSGKWESAKVRDLVDDVERLAGLESGVAISSVFVTKHEVLMMRKEMQL